MDVFLYVCATCLHVCWVCTGRSLSVCIYEHIICLYFLLSFIYGAFYIVVSLHLANLGLYSAEDAHGNPPIPLQCILRCP